MLQAARALADNITVVSAAGVLSETHMPFAGLHQLVQPLLGGIRVLPVPQRRAMEAAFGIGEAAAPDLFRIALATLDLLVDAAHVRPVLLLAEDAHWLDRATQDVLAFVARRAASVPIALLVAIRDGAGYPFRAPELSELVLPPLDDAAASDLLGERAPRLGAAARRRVLDLAAGNPLGLEELATDPAEAGRLPSGRVPLTTRLEDAFAARLPELPESTRVVLLVIAADGGCSLEEVLRAAAVVHGRPILIEALDSAIAAQLVQVDDIRVRFRHPLIGSATYQAATPAQRMYVHRALAGVLADHADRSTWHSAAAVTGPDDDVAARLEVAAEQARQRGAMAVSVAALERAGQLSHDPHRRTALLLRAAELACELGGRDMVVALLRDAGSVDLGPVDHGRVLLVREAIEPAVRADAARLEALVLAARTARDAGDSALAVNLLWAAATRCFWTSPPEGERATVAAAAAEIGEPPDDLRLSAVLAYTTPVGWDGFVALARETPPPVGDATASRLLGSIGFAVGDYHTAATCMAASAAGHRAQGRLGHLARTLSMLVWSAVFTGEWDTARTAATEGAALADETDQVGWQAPAEGVLAILAAYRGDAEHADRVARDIARHEPPLGAMRQFFMTQLIRGVAAIADGRHADAFGHLRRVFDPVDPAFHYRMRLSVVGLLAEAAADTDDVRSARQMVAELEPIAARIPAPCFQVGMRFARAVLATDEAAEPLFAAALRDDLKLWPVDHGRLLLAYGGWLRRHGRIEEARGPLRVAREVFDTLGAHPWSARARAELAAAGETSQRRVDNTRDMLTARKHSVIP